MGLGLAHIAFDRSNAMLALSGDFKFSAKNITHLQSALLFMKRSSLLVRKELRLLAIAARTHAHVGKK